MRRHHWGLVVLLCSLVASPTAAQRYHFHTYNELDGLPSSTVLDIAQDREGLLWFATARGLARFDGVEWDLVGPEGSTPTVRHFFIGRDHLDRMWTVGLDSKLRLFVLEDSVWREIELSGDFPQKPSYLNLTLGQTPDGKTFLAWARGSEALSIYCEGQWRRIQVGTGTTRVNALAFVDGRLAVGTGEGLFQIDPADWQLHATSFTEPILSICPDFAGRGMWAVGADWLAKGTADSLRIVAQDLPLEMVMRTAGVKALADQMGGLYFGDLGQVYVYHPTYGLEYLTRDSGLQSPGVSQFFLDREGHAWVACLRGLSKLVNRSLAGYDTRHGLFDDEVSAILRRSNGQMVLGHAGGLTFMDSIPRVLAFDQNNPFSERVTDLAESPDQRIWFAADHLGVGSIRPDGTLAFLERPEGLFRGAYAVTFDRQGRLWVGTDRGAFKWESGHFTQLDLSGFVGERPILIRRLVVANDGSMLICSGRHGLFRSRDGEVSTYATAADDPGLQTYNIHETASGEVLVATVAGLYVLSGDELKPATAPWPTIDRPVYSIMEDGKGQFWFGTDNGVLRWNGQRLVHLTNRDGLLGTETNRDALKLGPRGKVWIGTDRGLTIYRDDFDLAALAPPTVTVTGFDVDGIRHEANAPLQLSKPARALIVTFRSVTFGDKARTTYLTWLENFDEPWQGPDMLPDRSARYTNVPPGNYRFHVRVKGADGTLSPVARSEPIIIQPAVTERWWFVLLLIAAGLGVVWMIASYILGRRYAGYLKTRVRERTAELEHSEQNVRTESQRLAATLASISDGVITLDDQQRVIICNAAAERILDRDKEQIQGHVLSDLLTVEPELALVPGVPTTHAMSFADGRQSWVEFSVAPVKDPALGAAGTVLAFRDITARRDMENQKARAQQLESLGVLAGGIAHDFNNLLTIILGNVSLVKDSDIIGPPETIRLNKVKDATESARALTEQFLTFAKGGDPDLVPTSASQIVRQAAALAFSGAKVSCQLDLAPDLWNVNVDRGQIGQVLHNLFLNACQAMPSGGAVQVSGHNSRFVPGENEGGKMVCLVVEDTGVGISQEDLARIFDPYYTTKAKGSGLGLAIAHSIVRRHGGLLTAVSELGKGSTFTLILPATSLPVFEGLPQDRSEPLPAGRILIMDDEKEVLEVCGQLIEGLGLSCVVTSDGTEALHMYEAAQKAGVAFDAVIMDLTVPGGMGGKETMRRLLEIDPLAKTIVTSGYSNDPVMANYRDYGFQAALKKPFAEEDLKVVLAQALQRPRSEA